MADATVDAAPASCGTMPSARVSADGMSAYIVELCNHWDDDCDGMIDEGFDHDHDGYSTCPSASKRAVDCDDDDPLLHPSNPELCDGIDNDCDGIWDEGTDGECPTPVCSPLSKCPEGWVCIYRGELCARPAACPARTLTTATCEPPADNWKPDLCDPETCARWQSGTCWADCGCATDGNYRWLIGCTE